MLKDVAAAAREREERRQFLDKAQDLKKALFEQRAQLDDLWDIHLEQVARRAPWACVLLCILTYMTYTVHGMCVYTRV